MFNHFSRNYLCFFKSRSLRNGHLTYASLPRVERYVNWHLNNLGDYTTGLIKRYFDLLS